MTSAKAASVIPPTPLAIVRHTAVVVISGCTILLKPGGRRFEGVLVAAMLK